MPENNDVVLEVRGLTKRFPGVLANDHISLKVHRGEVLGLLGENGAGKSTLMNLIYGLYTPDEGEILVNGEVVRIKDPNDAIRRGIGMVHQHFQLVPVLTVTENVMLGNESTNGPFLDRRAARRRILEIANQYGLQVNPDALVQDLSVGVQQRVEIIKALYRKAEILILDEPSAVLTPQETEGLFEIMESLKARGVSIIFITHKLKEVLRICDRIMVLRLGKVVGDADPDTSTQESLASMMVGRSVLLQVDKTTAQPGNAVLDVQDLSVQDDRGLLAVRNVSLQVRRGEILGLAGVQGNGQTELVEAITGLRPPSGGQVFVDGRDITGASPRHVTEVGVAHVPEDRQKNGMVAPFPIKDNLRLQEYYKSPFSFLSTTLPLLRRLPRLQPVLKGILLTVLAVAGAVGFLAMPWFALDVDLTGRAIFETGSAIDHPAVSASNVFATLILVPAGLVILLVAGLGRLATRHALFDVLAFIGVSAGLLHFLSFGVGGEPAAGPGLLVTLAALVLALVVTLYPAESTSADDADAPTTKLLANDRVIGQRAAELVEKYDVRTPSIDTTIGALSGGNQQKVIIARELSRDTKLLIAAQPTRGLDVGSIEFIHQQIIKMRDEGDGVLLVSTELDEILSLSDRIAVMYAGQVIDTVDARDATRESIGLLMAGVRDAAEPELVSENRREGEL